MAILGPSLYRRRSQPLPTLLDEKLQLPPQQQQQPVPSTPATPSSSKIKPEGGSPRQPLVASGIIIRKVSKIFSGRSSKRPSKRIPKDQDSPNLRHAPVGHIAVHKPGALRYGSTTPSPSTESFDSDIRQPAGLGRLRTGSLSSNCEAELDSRVPHERVRALSTPTLLRMGEPGVGATSGIVRRVGGQRSLSRVPQAILNLIVSFLPRRYVTYVATVSWAFCEAARHTLYAHLDGRYIRPARFVKLISLLAVRHDLGLLTEALTIHVWPPSFYVEGEAQISMLAPSLPSFAKALLNMHRLKSITLPTFEYTILRYFSPLMLTKATFLNHTMSIGDHLQLRAWLECQEEIRHLAFPVLTTLGDAFNPNDASSVIPRIRTIDSNNSRFPSPTNFPSSESFTSTITFIHTIAFTPNTFPSDPIFSLFHQL
ncbi:hypothetical protein ONZ45_g8116 [Pleurotus djamor]|nr:hypothetical protein ONZ45_g8116 [Pleurotus djamor]